jgi:uncharacterized protein
MIVIDSDGHMHEPYDLFERYIDKAYWSRRPRIVKIDGHPLDHGRWLFEGKMAPRMPMTAGVGAGGLRYKGPRHTRMHARDDTLDDVPGRLADMDQLGIDVMVVYPTALPWVSDLYDHDLAAACCRAYNDYVANQCRQAPERLKAVALVPMQDPSAAAEEARRAVRELGLVGVTIPGIVGNEPLSQPKFLPFFEAIAELDTALGLHAVTGMHYTPWSDCFRDFFQTHITCMPFSMMVGLTSMIRAGLFERFANLRVGYLEIGASWLPYWAWWVGHHVAEWEETNFQGSPDMADWGESSYKLPSTRRPLEYIQEGRIYSGFETDENLRQVIDGLGAGALMYASDYPHGDMSWTRVPETRAMENLTGAEKDALLGGNAARFYKLPLTVPAASGQPAATGARS